MRYKSAALAAILLLVFVLPSPALARGCFIRPSTWREECANSKVVLYGTLSNPRSQPGDGTTDVLVDTVVKPHPLLGRKKVVTLGRCVAIDPQKPVRMLIFCDVAKGRIDPYRGVEAGPAAVRYLTGLLALDARDVTQRLRYCFDFLEHADPEVAADAFNEMSQAPDRELGLAARKFAPQKLLGWLKNPKTSIFCLRLYAILLGHCGGRTDATFLHAFAEKRVKRDCPQQLDGVLVGYTLLAPKDGYAYTCKLLKDPTNDFLVRYAALRALRYFHNTRPDAIGKRKVLEAMKIALVHEDMNDLAIDDLRRWRCWDLTARVLPLYGKPSKSFPVLRRAVVRYALQCPGPEAAAFLAERRKAEPVFVKDVEELLVAEQALEGGR
jgi:hypothetical protein